MIKVKDLNDVICQQDHLGRIVEFATQKAEDSTKMSTVCSLNTLNSIVCNLSALQRKNRVN